MKVLLTLLGCSLAFTTYAQDISLRHDLDGKKLDALATLVLRFNDDQKGKGRVLLQDSRGVENRQALPNLALLDLDDSMAFFGTRPRFHSLDDLMRKAGQRLDSNKFYPQMADAVDDARGKIQALPMGLSLPVLFINRAVLHNAGVNPDKPVKTWWELQAVAGAVRDRGSKCPFTTARFAWIHSENVSTQASEPMVGKIGKLDTVLANGMVNVKHLALLASWQKSSYFHYFGPGREGNQRFLSGECAMLTSESSLFAEARQAGIDVGVSPLPYYDDVYAPKQNDVLPDGASLWILAGNDKSEDKLAARFVTFLMRPDVQKEWVHATSYLPMTPQAVAALRESDIPPNLLDAAEKRLSVSQKGSTRVKHGLMRDRLHQFLGEEVEFVWNNGRPAKEALDNTVRRVNEAIATPPSAVAVAPR